MFGYDINIDSCPTLFLPAYSHSGNSTVLSLPRPPLVPFTNPDFPHRRSHVPTLPRYSLLCTYSRLIVAGAPIRLRSFRPHIFAYTQPGQKTFLRLRTFSQTLPLLSDRPPSSHPFTSNARSVKPACPFPMRDMCSPPPSHPRLRPPSPAYYSVIGRLVAIRFPCIMEVSHLSLINIPILSISP